MSHQLSVFQKWMILLMGVITVINFIDRSAISFVIHPLEKEFGITPLEFGSIAAAFGVGYSLSTLFGGVLVDRFGTVGTWALSAFFWSLVTLLMANGKGYASFFVLRVVLGVAEGLHFPALIRTVTDWIPSSWSARATSFGLFGVPFASVIGAPLVTFLVSLCGWRSMFIILGCIGMVWAVLWIALFRSRSAFLFNSVSATTGTFSLKTTPWKSIFFNAAFTKSCIVYFAYACTVFFFLMWTPGYLMKVHHISIQKTGLLLAIPWIFASLFMLVGGWLSDHLWKKTGSLRASRSRLIGLGLLLSGFCFIPMLFSLSLFGDIFWLSLIIGFASLLNAPIYALNADLFGPFTGIAQGILSFYFALAGIASPAITGWIVGSTGSFQSVFLILSCLSILTSFIVLFFQRPNKL